MKKRRKKETSGFFKNAFLYFCFGMTIILSLILILSWVNICYLPVNTTGECVIARSIISMKYFLIFLILETIFSAVVTILYLLDGFRYNIKVYKFIGIANILLQPFVVLGIINVLGRLLGWRKNYL